jgi:DNA-binding beta-propeller fold protein YncE
VDARWTPPVRKTVAALVCALAFTGCAGAHGAPAGPYRVAATIPVGGSGHWDYLTLDPAGHRLYMSHNAHVEVVDTLTRRRVGSIAVAGFSKGVAIVHDLNRGYVTVGTSSLAPGPEAHEADVFDLRTLRVVDRISLPPDPDGITYEASSKRVIAFTGESHLAVVIDPARDRIVKTVELPTAPGSAVADGRGHLFVSIAEQAEVVELDTTSFQISKRFPVDGCRIAVALALSTQTDRMFVACRNRTLAVIDVRSGANVAHVPIARHNDAAAYDPVTRTLFVSTLDGTLSIVRSDGGDRYRLVENLPTPPGSRTLALDPATHRVYLSSAAFAPLPLGAMRYPDPVDGTFGALVVEESHP